MMENTELEKRLDKIDEKLDKLTEITIKTAEQEIRLVTVEKQLQEMHNSKKAWINPVISAVISALMAFIISGGLKIGG